MAFNNLKAEMARMGYTQKDVADALEVSIKTADSLISERVSITIQRASRVRDKLFPDMTIDYLFRSY